MCRNETPTHILLLPHERHSGPPVHSNLTALLQRPMVSILARCLAWCLHAASGENVTLIICGHCLESGEALASPRWKKPTVAAMREQRLERVWPTARTFPAVFHFSFLGIEAGRMGKNVIWQITFPPLVLFYYYFFPSGITSKKKPVKIIF